MRTGAVFDATGTYRYLLWREWEPAAPRVGFVMLNPNRADAEVDDPTIRRCIGFARSWQFGGIDVVNLFAYRAATPATLRKVPDPVGQENDRHLAELCDRVTCIVLAWGNWGTLGDRHQAVLKRLENRDSIYCLGTTKVGQPRHPLYLRRDAALLPFLNAATPLHQSE